MKRYFIAFTLSLLFQQYVVAQGTVQLPDIKQVALPSPGATEFQKYGDYPVSFSTGIPDISIPLYTISSSRLQVPISLSYHAAGFKPADDNGIIGLGWTINAGARITRTVFGKTDEMSTSPNPVRNPDTIQTKYTSNQDYITTLANNTSSGFIDEDPDVFYYGTLNSSGKFILKNNGNGTRSPVITKFSPLKITSNTATYSGVAITYFEIVDDNGNTYHYGTGITAGTGGMETSLPNTTQPVNTFTSSWMLSEIISADKTDTVRFKYLGPFGGGTHRGSRTDNLVVQNLNTYIAQVCLGGSTCSAAGPGGYYYSNDNITWSTHSQDIISEIDYKFGKVIFDYAGPSSYNNSTGHNLYQIIVQNLQGITLKKYQLGQSNFGTPGNYNLSYYKLDELRLFSGNGTLINKYAFSYTNSTNASVPLGFEENLGIDYWGFYNGATGNTSLLPNWSVPTNSGTISAGSANREADETNMKNYVLNQIKYPTGGTTTFEFEGNKISGHTIGGLRIRRITNDPGIGLPTYKSYKYGNANGDESGFGVLQLDPYVINSFKQLSKQYNVCTCNSIQFTPTSIYDVTTYTSNFTDGSGVFETNPIFYPSVSEYDGFDKGTDNGRTIYIYALPSNTYLVGPAQRHLAIATDWYGGELLSKQVSKNTAGSYSILDQDDYTYQKRQIDDIIGTKVNQFLTGNTPPFTPYAFEQLFDQLNTAYNFWRYDITTGVNQLIQKTHTNSTGSGNLVNTENYTYSNFHNNPISIISVDSKALSREIDNKYPTDITLTGFPETARVEQVTKNILTPLLQSKSFVNNVQQLLVNKNYKDLGSGFPTPESIDMQVLGNPIEKRVQFLNYDGKMNLLSQSKMNDVVRSYIWDYQNSFPVAEVINSTPTDIAYTSFEANGTGNWMFTGNISTDPTAPTGNNSYNLGSSITKMGLSTTTTYTVSYWKKSGTVAVNGTTAVSGRTVNGWTYYEHKVVNPAGGLITVSGSGGIIDELRLYPSTAQMTSYTFDPVKGMTSQCDPNNRISYFEYDELGRLILVRDQDKNILKETCYNFSGQPEACSIFYNVVKTGIYQRLNCTGCLYGSGVTYTIAANSYLSTLSQADADQKALDEITANGQNYANANGTCGNPPAGPLVCSDGTTMIYTVLFHNTNASCSPRDYSFTVNAGDNNRSLGSVPVGTYDVTFTPNSGITVHTFKVNLYSLNADHGTIAGVPIGTSTNTVIIIP